MFSTSTQRKHWIFENEQKLTNLRMEANENYINNNPYKVPVSGVVNYLGSWFWMIV